VFMFFVEDAQKQGKINHPEVQGLMESAGLDQIQNPNRLCQKLKRVTEKIGFSYRHLMQRAKLHLEKSKKLQKDHRSSIKLNENNNKKCSSNDAIELSFKQQDYEEKFFSIYDKWTNRISSIRHAKIYDSERRLLADKKRNEVDAARSLFFDEFKETVQKNAADIGKYDLACENYAKLIKKYNQVLAMLKKEYVDFHNNKRQQVPINSSSQSQNNQASTGGLSGATGLYSSGEKYNAMVNVTNTLSPKIHSSFGTYVKSCGTDKKTRQKTMYSNFAGTKVKIPNNYAVINYYDGHYKNTALKELNEALASKSLSHADAVIKEYKDSMEHFTKLFTEIAEYYKMKDYADDDFKKGDQMHAPLMQAYESFLNADNGLRVMLHKISDAAVLQQINAYKDNNEHLFYFVEKAQYLAKKFYRYASHKKDYMTLNDDELKNRYQELRTHYNEFKEFKLKNETIFKDNNKYKGYLEDFSDYLSIVRDFQLHVKSKKRYDEGEEDFLKHVPEQARAMILSNRKGSLSQVLKAYNELVNGYNELGM